MEIKTIRRKQPNKVDKVKAKELVDNMRKEHSKMVKGMFEFVDAGSGWIEFNYRIFPEDMLVSYKFLHGETCEIPMGLVKHINNTRKKVRMFGMQDGEGIGGKLPNRGLPSSYEKTSRIRFVPIDMF